MTENEAKALLRAASDAQEWDAAVAAIIADNAGTLPAYWQANIIQSGFATKEMEKFRAKPMYKGRKPNYEVIGEAQ